MEPIRVAQVMGYMNGGGVESVVMNYYRHIDREKVQFDFIVCEESTLIPREEIEGLGGRIFMVPDYKKLPQYLGALVSLFKREGWHIVHSHMNSLSVFSLYAAKKAGVPVRIAHSHSTSGNDGFARNMLKNVLRSLSKRYPTNLAACSERAAEWLFGSDCDCRLFPNGVDTKQFKDAKKRRDIIRSQLGISEGALVLGHVGRFAKQKNHAFLLEIFMALKEISPNTTLLLVGDGPLFSEIDYRVQELGLDDDVLLLGQRDDIPDLLAAMDVFCLPSLYEGLPVVGIECQAAGLPILVSNSVTQELKKSSFVEFESLESPPKEWANRVLDLASERELVSSGLEEYDIEKCSAGLCKYYLDLSAGQRLKLGG